MEYMEEEGGEIDADNDDDDGEYNTKLLPERSGYAKSN